MVDPEAHRFCAGSFHLPGSSPSTAKTTTSTHGAVDLDDAIARSCDVYFYGLADEIGVDRIAAFMAPFGFGALTGIDISGEKAGILPSRAWKEKTFSRPADQRLVPRRDGELRHRPGLPDGDAAAAGALRQRARHARPASGSRAWWPPTATRGTGQLHRIAPVSEGEVRGVSRR